MWFVETSCKAFYADCVAAPMVVKLVDLAAGNL